MVPPSIHLYFTKTYEIEFEIEKHIYDLKSRIFDILIQNNDKTPYLTYA